MDSLPLAGATLCGRLTKRGTPCQLWPSVHNGGCAHHLTPEEATRVAAATAAATATFLASPFPLDPVPACHRWPVLTVEELRVRFEERCLQVAEDDPFPQPSERLRRLTLASWDDLEAMSTWQAGRCAVCGSTGDRLVLDHCHRTALCRGYLCGGCNRREAHGQGPPWTAYRTRPPTVILGIKVVYWSPFTGYAVPEPEPDEEAMRQAAGLLQWPWRDNSAARLGL